jgi:uncharacterized protein YeaO (DUF488 family)
VQHSFKSASAKTLANQVNYRALADRLWPRMSKKTAAIHVWTPCIAPSYEGFGVI